MSNHTQYHKRDIIKFHFPAVLLQLHLDQNDSYLSRK